MAKKRIQEIILKEERIFSRTEKTYLHVLFQIVKTHFSNLIFFYDLLHDKKKMQKGSIKDKNPSA